MLGTRILLVGCGIWGSRILDELLSLDAVVVVIEVDPARAVAAGKRAQIVADIRSAPEIDGVVVATPATTHFKVLNEILDERPGVPILCEKPLTASLPEAIQIAERAGDRLFVGHIWRYHPGIVELGKIARSGRIGRVTGVRSTRANWASPRSDVDSAWNLAPHDMTLAIEILGKIPEPKFAVAEVIDGQARGFFGVLGGDPWLIFEASNRYADKRREVRVHGERGVAVLADVGSRDIELFLDGDDPREPIIERLPLEPANPLAAELRDWLDFIRGIGSGPKSGAQEGVRVVEAVHRLRRLAGLA